MQVEQADREGRTQAPCRMHRFASPCLAPRPPPPSPPDSTLCLVAQPSRHRFKASTHSQLLNRRTRPYHRHFGASDFPPYRRDPAGASRHCFHDRRFSTTRATFHQRPSATPYAQRSGKERSTIRSFSSKTAKQSRISSFLQARI